MQQLLKFKLLQWQTVLTYHDKEGNKSIQTKDKHDDGASSTEPLSNRVRKRKWSSNEDDKVTTNKRGVVGQLVQNCTLTDTNILVYLYCA